MELSALCKHIGVICPKKYSSIDILGVTSNSKKVKKDYLFVSLKGLHTDGNEYISEALENGAAAVIAENAVPDERKIIKVSNARKALSLLCDALADFPSRKMSFVGVTGTNGKTSVSTMLWHILNRCGMRCSLIGTVGIFAPNGEKLFDEGMTTPDPEELYPYLARLYELGTQIVVSEASSHSLYLDKLFPINFDIGIFTNLTQDHLDFHKNMEDYFLSKAKLFNQSKKGIINIDDFFGARLGIGDFCTQKSCSIEKKADFYADDIELLGERGVKYRLLTPYGELKIRCKTAGSFSVINSMQACACALELGVEKEKIEKAVKDFSGVSGRLERVDLPKDIEFSVFIDYAHTPDALEKVIKALKEAKGNKGKLTVLFGCGGNRDKDKRAKMGKIATDFADKVIITSDNPREESKEEIIKDILLGVNGKNNFTVITERKDAIKFAVQTACRGDFILFAGKGHERYEIIGKEKFFFDEREIVKSLINKNSKEDVL